MVVKYNLEMDRNLIPQVVKEKEYAYEGGHLDSPEAVTRMLNACLNLRYQCEERVIMICCNNRLAPQAVFEVAHGTVNLCQVSTREIIQRALLCGATSFLIAHNHPTQDTAPSIQDRMFRDRLEEACGLMCMELLDFIIVGDTYYSFKESEPTK